MAWISPRCTLRRTSCSAVTPWKRLVMPRISRMGGAAGVMAVTSRSLDLAFLVVPAVDEHRLPVRRINSHRLEQVRGHDLDAVVVRLGVVDLGLLAAEHGIHHVDG